MFHLLAYNRNASADTNHDMLAVTDPVFSQRNSHFIFSEPYQAIGLAGFGVSATEFRLNMPSVLVYGYHNIWPLNASLTPPSFPRIQDLKQIPFYLPLNEECAWQVTDPGAEYTEVFMWITPAPFQPMLAPMDMNRRRTNIKWTMTYTQVQHGWSGPAAITLEQTPRGGWYSINGAYCYSANAQAFRLFLPRAATEAGRILRPGDLVTHAIGDMIIPRWATTFGEWGRFHTFELPQAEFYSDGSGSDTVTGYLDVTFLGDQSGYSIPVGGGQNIPGPGQAGYQGT
jgi:hypothetical protein